MQLVQLVRPQTQLRFYSHSLFKSLVALQAVEFAFVLHYAVARGHFARFHVCVNHGLHSYGGTDVSFVRVLALTVSSSQNMSRLDFEVDCAFNKQWIELEHFLVVVGIVLVLNLIAAVVQTGGANVTTRSLQTVCLRLHLVKVALLNSFCQRFQRWIQRQHLQFAQHLVENLGLVAQQDDSSVHID